MIAITRVSIISLMPSVTDARLIERDHRVHVRWKTLLHLSHQLVNAGGRVDGVRTGQLVHRDNGARFTIQTT